MSDPYLYEEVPVLKNKLGIKNEQTLDRIEAEQSRANMMLLYERGFQDFSPDGLRRSTGPCLVTFTNGPASTASSILKNGRSCWQAEAFGTATKTGSRKISMRLLGGWETLAGTASAGSNLFISLPVSFRQSGRCIPSGRAIPERL